MIISFAWTTPSILDRTKTVTRRDWTTEYARKFHAGDIVDAYDKNPRAGGKKIGQVHLTSAPYRQRLTDMPNSHFEREGGLRYWHDKEEYIAMMGGPKKELWVIEFEVLEAKP